MQGAEGQNAAELLLQGESVAQYKELELVFLLCV